MGGHGFSEMSVSAKTGWMEQLRSNSNGIRFGANNNRTCKLGQLPNVDVVDKNKGTENALSFVGQHAHVEKEMMEVSSPKKPKAGPTNIRTISDDNLSPTGEGNGKVKCQLKNIAREKGKKIYG